MIRRVQLILLAALLAAAMATTGNAQVVVTPATASGNDATLAAALNSAFNSSTFGNDLADIFLKPEAENLSRTNVIGALQGHPGSDATIMSGLTPGFMVGFTAGGTGGVSESRDVPLGNGTVNFPLAAGTVGFNAYAGINLGLWGMGLPNIDVIVHQGGGSFSREFGEYEIGGSSYRGGVFVRYHVLNPINLLLVKFLGLSIGTGYAYQNIDFELSRNSTDSLNISGIGAAGWRNKQSIEFEATNSVIPVQVQTGLNVLFILNVHAGLGYAFAFGDTEVSYSNTGRVSTTIANADVSMVYSRSAEAESTAYVFGGAELKIFLVHLGVEGIWNLDSDDSVYGLTMYARLQW